MKKILFLGAGFHQSYAIQRARALGYYTIAIDHLENSVGFEYAHQKVKMDVTNLQGCLAIAQINQVHGVMNSYMDAAVMTAAHIISEMNLPGINEQIVQSIKDKFTLRSILYQSNITESEKVYLLSQVDELHEVLDFINFPVLVKPLGMSEEAGLSKKANNIVELEMLFNQAYEFSKVKQVMIEDYLEGREFNIEAFVTQDEIHVYGVLEKLKEFNPEYKEIGYKTLATLPDYVQLEDLISRSIKALGIESGSVNIEVIQTADLKYHIANVKPGVGGSIISSHIIPKVLRYNYIDNAIRAAVSDPFELPEIRYARNIVTRKLVIKADQHFNLIDVSKFEKEHRVKLYFKTNLKDNEEQVLYIIGAEDSTIKAEENVKRATSLIQEKYIDEKGIVYKEE